MAEGSQKHKTNFLQRIVTLSLRGENYDDAINYSNKLLQYYIEVRFFAMINSNWSLALYIIYYINY